MSPFDDVTRVRPSWSAVEGAGVRGAMFDSALRGYDRGQVDEHVTALSERIAWLVAALNESELRCRAVAEHADATPSELRAVRAAVPAQAAAPEAEGFGLRAEKLLRLAEEEAAETRAQSNRESVAVLELAHAEAAKHRRDVEQAWAERAARLDDELFRHSSELADRELRIAATLEATKAEAEELRADATRTAERVRDEAVASAAEIKRHAEADAARLRHDAERDVAHLCDLRVEVQDELARLAERLVSELPSQPGSRSAAHGDAPPDGAHEAQHDAHDSPLAREHLRLLR